MKRLMSIGSNTCDVELNCYSATVETLHHQTHVQPWDMLSQCSHCKLATGPPGQFLRLARFGV